MPAGAVEIGNVQVIAVCLLYGIGFYWAEYLSQTSHFPGAILATLVVAVAASLCVTASGNMARTRWRPEC